MTDRVHPTIPDIPNVQLGMLVPTLRLYAILISSHSSRQTEDVRSSGERWEIAGGGHRRHHLYFIDLSISVSVHGWEVGERSLSTWPARQPMLGLYQHTPYLSPPVRDKRSDSGSLRGFGNHNERDAAGDS